MKPGQGGEKGLRGQQTEATIHGSVACLGPLLNPWPWWTWDARHAPGPFDLEDLKQRNRDTQEPTHKGGDRTPSHTIIYSVNCH